MKDINLEFEFLLKNFARLTQKAQNLESPNPEDDQFIKAAMVGFSKYSRTEEWAQEHYRYIQSYRMGDYSDTSLAVLHGEKAGKAAVFACLCLGLLLGMYQAEEISDEEFKIAEAQLPGFMLMNTGIFSHPA